MKEKFCTKCGNKLEDIDKFCGKCGEPVPGAQTQVVDGNIQQVVVQPVNPRDLPISPEDNRTANILSLISLAMHFLGPVFIYIFALFGIRNESMFEALSGTLSLAALGLLIYVRVKYPKNILSKVLLIIFLILFIGSIVLIAVAVIACAIACGSVDTSGCS